MKAFFHLFIIRSCIVINTRINMCEINHDKEKRYIKMPLTPHEMIKYFKKNGFKIVGHNGSHVKMRNDETGHQTEAPYYSTGLKKSLDQAILKQAGLKITCCPKWRLYIMKKLFYHHAG